MSFLPKPKLLACMNLMIYIVHDKTSYSKETHSDNVQRLTQIAADETLMRQTKIAADDTLIFLLLFFEENKI